MVKYKTILKIIENETQKTHYSLKNIKSQIQPLIHQIVDSSEEEEILLDRISRFHKEFWNSSTEKMYLEGHTGNVYTEYERGTAYEVPYPEDGREEGKTDGMLLAMHNHTPDSMFYPSGADLYASFDEKYIIIVNTNGISITKREKLMYEPQKMFAKEIGIWKYKDIMKMADETPEGQKLNNMLQKISKEEGVDMEELQANFVEDYVKIETKVMLDNTDLIFTKLNESFKRGSQFEDSPGGKPVPMTTYYTFLKSDEQLKRG